MTKNEPHHPGKLLRTQLIDRQGLTVTQAATILGVGRQALSTLLNERAALSPEMALRIEKAFGISMEITLRMQLAHDLIRLRERDDEFAIEPYTGLPASSAGHSR